MSACVQVESVQLAAESTTKQLEAELAALKRDAAQAAAAHKSAAPSWQSDLDWQSAEVPQDACMLRPSCFGIFMATHALAAQVWAFWSWEVVLKVIGT